VLRLVVDGSSPDEIAAMLGISRHTVRTHLQNIMAKLLVSSRIEMVSVARSSGMRPIPVEPPR
jgi:DNA-binding CsgD family transcriptional regulator